MFADLWDELLGPQPKAEEPPPSCPQCGHALAMHTREGCGCGCDVREVELGKYSNDPREFGEELTEEQRDIPTMTEFR